MDNFKTQDLYSLYTLKLYQLFAEPNRFPLIPHILELNVTMAFPKGTTFSKKFMRIQT